MKSTSVNRATSACDPSRPGSSSSTRLATCELQCGVYLAHDAAAVNTSGRSFGPALEEIGVPERARRVDRRARLWSVSEELTARYLAAAETLERPPRLATAAR